MIPLHKQEKTGATQEKTSADLEISSAFIKKKMLKSKKVVQI